MLEPVLVCQNRQHPLETLVGKLDDSAATLADQVLVICLGGHRLIAFEPFAKVVGPGQATLHQKLERAVHRCGTNPLTLLPELSTDSFHGQVILGKKEYLRNKVALASDWLVVFPEMAAEAL